MKKLALLTVVLATSLAALAAGGDLVGTWKVDTLKIMAMLGQTPPDGADPAELAEQYTMTIEMTKDGAWTFTSKMPTGEQVQKGAWKEISREGSTVTIETSDDSGQTQEFVLTFEDKNTIVAKMPDGPHMYLERVK